MTYRTSSSVRRMVCQPAFPHFHTAFAHAPVRDHERDKLSRAEAIRILGRQERPARGWKHGTAHVKLHPQNGREPRTLSLLTFRLQPVQRGVCFRVVCAVSTLLMR